MIQRAVQVVLTRGLNDPRIRGLVSVTRVEVTEDLAEGAVSVSVIPAAYSQRTIAGLHHAAKHIQAKVNQAVRLRRVPRLSFRLDESIKREAGVHAALAEARRADDRLPSHADSRSEDPSV